MTDTVEKAKDTERVARAIFNHMFAKHERGLWGSDDFLRNNYLDCARTVLAELRVPTPEMIEAMLRHMTRRVVEAGDVAVIWRAGVDALIPAEKDTVTK